MSYGGETVITATTKNLFLRTVLTKVIQRFVQKLVLTTKRLVISISRKILIKHARKTRAVQIAIVLIFKKFKVIKIVTAQIIVITTTKLKLLIMQIKSRFADLSRRLNCLLNTIIINISIYKFKTCKRRLTIWYLHNRLSIYYLTWKQIICFAESFLNWVCIRIWIKKLNRIFFSDTLAYNSRQNTKRI